MRRVVLFFAAIDRGFARAIDALTIVILLGMAVFTLLQVFLRDLLSSGIPGVEIGTRHMVLWITFLGAMLATRNRQHVSIDMVTRILPRRKRNAVRIILDAVACVVAFFLARAAFDFVLNEKQMGGVLMGNIPTWWAQAIIPFGFAVISFEYAIGIILDVRRILEVGSDRHEAGEGRKTQNA